MKQLTMNGRKKPRSFSEGLIWLGAAGAAQRDAPSTACATIYLRPVKPSRPQASEQAGEASTVRRESNKEGIRTPMTV